MNRRIALIACSSTKGVEPAPARDLYTGALFRLAVRYADQSCDGWVVLSAKRWLARQVERRAAKKRT